MIIKKVLYIKEVKKNLYLQKKYCVDFEPNYNKKDLLFLSDSRFIKVLTWVQFTAMGSLFQ